MTAVEKLIQRLRTRCSERRAAGQIESIEPTDPQTVLDNIQPWSFPAGGDSGVFLPGQGIMIPPYPRKKTSGK